MNKMQSISFAVLVYMLSSCATAKNYNPAKKLPRQSLQQDFTLLRNILEKKHPSIYWYTSKDSMDSYFAKYYREIPDSMTELQFAWHIIAPLVDKLHCGHTSVNLSKAYVKWADGKRFPSFPLYMKVWNDTMAVTANLNRRDSVFKRGTLVTSVNGIKPDALMIRMFDFLPEDGYANNINYIRMSANFPYYHRNIYGLSKSYKVGYIDSLGQERIATIPVFVPTRDTTKKKRDSAARVARKTIPRSRRLLAYRSLNIDSNGKFAVMTLNTFSKGRLRSFFRKSFKTLQQKNINHLVLDIRSNGGGRVGMSTLLTRYISRKPFRVADSLYAVTKSMGPYTKYVKGTFINNLEMFFISRKRADGLYHIGHLENRTYNPKSNHHYNGKLYVLTNGPTFSAATLFANVVKGQEGIQLIGEETGGGWHGNSGIMIPDIRLPNSKVRVRLPLFRLVQYNHVPRTGSGIPPDWYIGTSYEALLKGYDKKMEVVKEMIIKETSQSAATIKPMAPTGRF